MPRARIRIVEAAFDGLRAHLSRGYKVNCAAQVYEDVQRSKPSNKFLETAMLFEGDKMVEVPGFEP